jgi:hypothetical protein
VVEREEFANRVDGAAREWPTHRPDHAQVQPLGPCGSGHEHRGRLIHEHKVHWTREGSLYTILQPKGESAHVKVLCESVTCSSNAIVYWSRGVKKL